MTEIPLVKRCTACGELKPIADFSRNANMRDGYLNQCRLCRNNYAREHYIANRESKLEYQNAYYLATRSYQLQYKRARYRQNHAQELEYRRQWRATNKDYIREWCTSPSGQNSRRAARSNRRARERNLPNSLTGEHVHHALESFGFCCAVCGQQLNGLFHREHLDHWIPLNSATCPGTVPNNMVPLCAPCNLSKGAAMPIEWLTRRYGHRKARAIMARIEDWLGRQAEEFAR